MQCTISQTYIHAIQQKIVLNVALTSFHAVCIMSQCKQVFFYTLAKRHPVKRYDCNGANNNCTSAQAEQQTADNNYTVAFWTNI